MPEVAIIIPVYNKELTVGRAIKSAAAQEFSDIEIVIVDDGSTDKSPQEINKTLAKLGDDRIKYVRQENQGVANARNNGVFKHSTAPYVMCLDADDAIEPGYVSGLLPVLKENRRTGIVFTKLYYFKEDGHQGVSPWPNGFDVVAQFAGRNQIPTAALTRRVVWERLGGQRQRFAPDGAGAEDGDFWYRAVSRGFMAEFVPLRKGSWFLYSLGSGLVSGNKDYVEPFYRAWSPWHDRPELMPGPSIAQTSKRSSHGVRWYDEPRISVIIPVGDGHLDILTNALDSLDAQTFRHFETIVVFDVRPETWELAREEGLLRYISSAWPDCTFTSTAAGGRRARDITDKLQADLDGKSILDDLPAGQRAGPGAARNIGIDLARGALLFFLDADDWIVPETLEKMLFEFARKKGIIYSDHIGIATIPPDKLGQVDGKVVSYNEKKHEAYVQQGVSDYNCELAMRQPILDGRPPYVICNVSALIPKSWVKDVGKFDTELVSWEDVILMWRLAWAGHCFYRVPEPLLVYRYGTGTMRQTGLANARELLEYASALSSGIEKMGCNCGKNKLPVVQEKSSMTKGTAVLRLSRGGQLGVGDSELVLVDFSPQQHGHMQRYGQHDFGNGNRIAYGVKKEGDRFLVHRFDYEAEQRLAAMQGRNPEMTLVVSVEDRLNEVSELEELPEEPELVDEVEEVGELEQVDYEEPVEEAADEAADEEESILPPPHPGGPLTPIEDLDVDLPNAERYVRILNNNLVYTAQDIMDAESNYEDGLAHFRLIGPKIREAFVSAAEGVMKKGSIW